MTLYSEVVLTTCSTPVWTPLESYLGKKELCQDFMYMQSVKLASNVVVHTYKNCDSRVYINLSGDGRSWEYGGKRGYREIFDRESNHFVGK